MAQTMKAAIIEKPEKLVVKEVPVPEVLDDEVLIKVKYTGICGTDWSIYTGKYSADRLPLIPGHEFSGIIVKAGKNAKQLKEGDRVTADINMSCGSCFYCKKGLKLMCREFTQLGIERQGLAVPPDEQGPVHLHEADLRQAAGRHRAEQRGARRR